MALSTPPRLVDVRCPVSGHLLFRAMGQGTVIDIRCACKRIVRVEALHAPRIMPDR
jgi:hypothetical protein